MALGSSPQAAFVGGQPQAAIRGAFVRTATHKADRMVAVRRGRHISYMVQSTPRILSVNVGRARTVASHRRQITTGIFKQPVDHGVALPAMQLDGDEQADLESHGGIDKAVYAYGHEDYAWWEGRLGRRLDPGTFGENLTTEGITVSEAVIGERWRVGTAVVEVSQPRMPCYKLSMKMDDPQFVHTFAAGRRPGAYLRVIERRGRRTGRPCRSPEPAKPWCYGARCREDLHIRPGARAGVAQPAWLSGEHP